MATVTKFANAHTAIVTGYTDPTNAYGDDGSYTTAIPAKNTDVSAYWGFPAFSTSDIPDGSTINTVTVIHGFLVSTQASQAQEYIQVFLNTTGQGTEQSDLTEPLTETILQHQVSSGISVTDLRIADVVHQQGVPGILHHHCRHTAKRIQERMMDRSQITFSFTVQMRHTEAKKCGIWFLKR